MGWGAFDYAGTKLTAWDFYFYKWVSFFPLPFSVFDSYFLRHKRPQVLGASLPKSGGRRERRTHSWSPWLQPSQAWVLLCTKQFYCCPALRSSGETRTTKPVVMGLLNTSYWEYKAGPLCPPTPSLAPPGAGDPS